MKKVLFWLLGIIVVFLIVVFVLLFTQPGNSILKPIIQTQISTYARLPLKIEKFSLRPSSLHLLISQQDHIQALLEVNFSLISQKFQGRFDFNAQNLEQLPDTFYLPLHGGFTINATFQGKPKDFDFNMLSNIAQSRTHIQAMIKNFDVREIHAQIQNLRLEKLPINQALYTTGRLHLQADVKKGTNNEFEGKLVTELQGGKVDEKLVQKDFKFNIPKTNFSTLLKADFKDNIIQSSFKFFSNIGSISTQGILEVPTLTINGNYEVALSDLLALAPLLKTSLRGAFKTKGTIKSDTKTPNTLLINGTTDIANSDSLYQATLENFSLKNVSFQTKKLAIDKLLWMAYIPEYINAQADFKLQVKDFDKMMSLDIAGKINGKTQNKPIKKAFDIDMPDKSFEFKTKAYAKGSAGKFDIDFDSPLASFKVQQADFNLEKITAQGKYDIALADLGQLQFITGRKLQGAINLNGKFGYDKNMYVDFASHSLGGLLDGKLENSQFKAHLEKIDSKKFFYFLQLSELAEAFMDGDMTYNLAKETGNISLLLKDGKILPNQLTQAFKKYAKFDVAKEVFETIRFDSSIKKWVLDAKFDMQSNDVKIVSDRLKVNLPNNKIDTKIKLSMKSDFVYAIVSGDLNSPKTQIDASHLVKSQASKAIEKGAEKAVEKYIPKQNQDKIKNLLNKALKGF